MAGRDHGGPGAGGGEDERRAGYAHDALAGNAGVTGERILALLDDDGNVLAWARGADIGAEIDVDVGIGIGIDVDVGVGERAAFFLGSDDGDDLTVSALAERRGSPDGWSSELPAADGDGDGDDDAEGDDDGEGDGAEGRLRVLQISRLTGAGGEVCWLLRAHRSANAVSLRAGLRPEAAAASGAKPAGLALWDPRLRCVAVNEVLEQQDGVPPENRLGRRMTEALPGADADAIESLMGSILRTGAPAIDYRCLQPDRTDPARHDCLAVTMFRLDGADGNPIGVCSLSMDITRERRVRDHLAILGQASRCVGTQRDVMSTAQEMAEFAVPLIADYVTVDLAGSVELGGEPLALLNPDAGRIPLFHRAGVKSVHSGVPESLWQRGTPVFVPLSSPFTQVLRHGKSYFHPVLDPAVDTWLDPQRARVVEATGMHSLMMVPVHEPGAPVLGIAVFVRNANAATFTEDDLELAEELVAQTSRRLENARRFSRQHTTARALQRNLLPHYLDGGPALEISSNYVPADLEEGLGGDWYDVVARSDARIALIIGDVVGHGIGAAAAMGRLRTAIRTLEYMDLAPDEILRHLDQIVVSLAEDDLSDTAAVSTTTGATCLLLSYDPRTRRASAASAGHPPPIVIDPEGVVTFPRIPVGPPIGTGLAAYERTEFEIAEGSLLALYTDGLVEGRHWMIETGMRRLANALAQPGRSLDELVQAAFAAQPADEFRERAELQLKPPKDDATLLLVRTRPLPPAPEPSS